MKVLRKLFLVTLLLASVNNVFAEGNWQFGLEVGSPWIECSSSYTGSTADALGCSGKSLSQNNTRFVVPRNDFQKHDGSLKLTANSTKTNSVAPSLDGKVADSNTFWTTGNGETLSYSQVMLSAMLHKTQDGRVSDPPIDILPYELNSDETIAVVVNSQ